MKKRIKFIIIILLVLGVFLRFVNLDKKVYWIDEVYTSLRISGYTQAELVQEVTKGQLLSVADLQKYQRPNSEKGVIGTVKGLALEEPQIPPLYFVMARFWVLIFGPSEAVTRGFSALISLLAFPCIYWLCLELFESSVTGWVAMGLIAISPLQVLYAKEARNYSLWSVMILLSSWALLRAIRLNKKPNWLVYGATVAFGLYSHLFFALVALGHGIYVLATQGFRWSKTVGAYLLASMTGLLAFTPWIWIVINNSTSIVKTTGFQSERTTLPFLVINWLGNISRGFLDLGVNSYASLAYLVPLSSLIVTVLIIVGYSMYFLCRNTATRVWLFVITLISVPALALILPDLLFGGYRSALSRYLIPLQLGIQLAVTYLIATKITLKYVQNWREHLWKLIGIVLVLSGVVSGVISSQSETWWNMAYAYQISPVTSIINKASRPLTIAELSGNNLGNLIAVSYRLDQKVQFLLLDKPSLTQIPDGFSEVFLYGDSKTLKNQLEQESNFKIEPIYKDPKENKIWLYKLVKKS
jgi:uncharacterized membrane protein